MKMCCEKACLESVCVSFTELDAPRITIDFERAHPEERERIRSLIVC